MAWFSDSGYWLGRLVFQRMLAVLYVVAFLAAVRQFRALIGARGMLPVPAYVATVPFRAAPSVFHWHYSDRFFALWSWSGVLLAAAVAAGPRTPYRCGRRWCCGPCCGRCICPS